MTPIFKKSIPRRTLLRGIGAAVALPLLDAMVPAFAAPSDAAAKPVVRLGFVYVPNGMIMENWTPESEGAGFKLTRTLESLAPFQNQMLVLSSLNQKEANAWPGEGGAYHTRSCSVYLTGVHPKKSDGRDMRAGVSADQLAARVLGKETQLASLEMALDPTEASGTCEGSFACAYMNTISWRTPTTPMPMEDRPRVVFERLFGDSNTTDRNARLAVNRHNRSLLDDLAEEVASIQRGLGSRDRNKLTQYLDATRDVERRIELAEQQSARELPTLERPAGGYPATYEEYAKLMLDLQVLAFQTDMTRVGTFMFAHERSARAYADVGVPDAHHALSHHRGDPKSIEKLAKVNAYHVKLFAYYLGKLRSTPDGDGSLLDHSMIVYGAGMSDSNLHLNENLPTLLLGGGGGKLKGGRHIRYAVGTPITNLYRTLLDMVGAPVEKLGDSNGTVEHLSIA